MDKAKRKHLESAGWKIGTVKDFFDLSSEEAAYIELKLQLAKNLQKRRIEKKLTQTEVARMLKSSQSRVAKMEAGDPTVWRRRDGAVGNVVQKRPLEEIRALEIGFALLDDIHHGIEVLAEEGHFVFPCSGDALLVIGSDSDLLGGFCEGGDRLNEETLQSRSQPEG